jgi:hypothetical protein
MYEILGRKLSTLTIIKKEEVPFLYKIEAIYKVRL